MTRQSLSLSSAVAMLLAASAVGCAPKRTETILLEPPDLPPTAFEELVTGQCPETLEWYWEDFDPWLEKFYEARDAVE